jgi:PIN domain nuclease of toxin-antitoxin system
VEGDQEVILLDTHVLIWLAGEPDKLSQKAVQAIRAASHEGGLGIAAITLWELAWLITHGRIAFAGTPRTLLEKLTARTAILPITPSIAVLANELPANYSADPCDRLIGATALAEGIPVITKDAKIRACAQIQTIW